MPLPYCHSRRNLPDDSTTFFCAHPRMHVLDQLVTSTICKACVLWKEPPPEQHRPFDPTKIIHRAGPCRYLGAQIGWRDCPTCIGNVRLKVFACAHPNHESTTYDECHQCQDYQVPVPTL